MSYGSIPSTPVSSDDLEPCTEKVKGSSRNLGICLAVLLGAFAFMSMRKTPITDPIEVPPPPEPEGPPAVHWPPMLSKIDSALRPIPNIMPFTSTEVAAAAGWAKSDEPCDPMLGEAWLYGGERSSKVSAAIYFTPDVGDTPGVISGIETDFYGYVEENLIGLFFGEEKISKDGSFRSLSVALRNGEEEDLCSTTTPVAPGNAPFVLVSPGMANMRVPVTEDDPELLSEFQEGSCIPPMGYHWERFLAPVKELPYKAKELVPIVPMYSSIDGTLNGIFFLATSRKQNFPAAECPELKSVSDPCLHESGKMNFWDTSPGLRETTCGRFFACSNFCGECELTGSPDGMYTTMHWFFRNTFAGPYGETCGGFNGPKPYCRSGVYPSFASPEECGLA